MAKQTQLYLESQAHKNLSLQKLYEPLYYFNDSLIPRRQEAYAYDRRDTRDAKTLLIFNAGLRRPFYITWEDNFTSSRFHDPKLLLSVSTEDSQGPVRLAAPNQRILYHSFLPRDTYYFKNYQALGQGPLPLHFLDAQKLLKNLEPQAPSLKLLASAHRTSKDRLLVDQINQNIQRGLETQFTNYFLIKMKFLLFGWIMSLRTKDLCVGYDTSMLIALELVKILSSCSLDHYKWLSPFLSGFKGAPKISGYESSIRLKQNMRKRAFKRMEALGVTRALLPRIRSIHEIRAYKNYCLHEKLAIKLWYTQYLWEKHTYLYLKGYSYYYRRLLLRLCYVFKVLYDRYVQGSLSSAHGFNAYEIYRNYEALFFMATGKKTKHARLVANFKYRLQSRLRSLVSFRCFYNFYLSSKTDFYLSLILGTRLSASQTIEPRKKTVQSSLMQVLLLKRMQRRRLTYSRLLRLYNLQDVYNFGSWLLLPQRNNVPLNYNLPFKLNPLNTGVSLSKRTQLYDKLQEIRGSFNDPRTNSRVSRAIGQFISHRPFKLKYQKLHRRLVLYHITQILDIERFLCNLDSQSFRLFGDARYSFLLPSYRVYLLYYTKRLIPDAVPVYRTLKDSAFDSVLARKFLGTSSTFNNNRRAFYSGLLDRLAFSQTNNYMDTFNHLAIISSLDVQGLMSCAKIEFIVYLLSKHFHKPPRTPESLAQALRSLGTRNLFQLLSEVAYSDRSRVLNAHLSRLKDLLTGPAMAGLTRRLFSSSTINQQFLVFARWWSRRFFIELSRLSPEVNRRNNQPIT